MSYTTPAMLNAMKKAAYDSENGCTAEPSECTVDKAKNHGNEKRYSRNPDLPLEKLVVPSAEEEFIASLELEAEDCMYIPSDIKDMDALPSKKTYSGDVPQDDIYAALAKGEEPKDLGNAHYGASPKLPEQKSEDVERALKWKRDGKNAKVKKLRSKDSIIFLL